MCPNRSGRRRKLQIRMTIRRVSGVRRALRRTRREPIPRGSPAAGEDRHQLLWRNHFELSIGTVARLLVRAPSSKMRHVTKAGSLHMLVSHFDHQFGPQRLPREVLALAPAALAAWHATR